MRILVVGPVEGGSLEQGLSLFRALLRQGQEAVWLDFTDLQPYQNELDKGTTGPNFFRDFVFKQNQRLLEKILEFRPDMVLGIAQSMMHDTEVLEAIRAAGIRLCYWFVEDHAYFPYWQKIAPYFDDFFIIQKDPLYSLLKEIGCRNVHYLPIAYDFCLPRAPVTGQDIQISFVGTPFLNRVKLLGEIVRPDLKIFGQDWRKFDNPCVVVGGRRLNEMECHEIYARTKVNLNIHSSRSISFAEGDFVNPRTFDLAGLGVFQLVDKRSLLPQHFDPVNEVPMFDNWNAYKEAIDYYLQRDDERQSIILNAQKRVFAEHTYDHRVRELISLVS